MVYRTRTKYSTTASSMASIGGGGRTNGTSREVTDHSKIYFLVLSEPKDYADGDRLKDIFAVDNSKTKSYTNTLEATQTVMVLNEVTPVDLSQDEFVEKLKKGESWLLKRFKEKSCTFCFGDGKLSASTNYAKCPDCNGKGSTLLDCVIKW